MKEEEKIEETQEEPLEMEAPIDEAPQGGPSKKQLWTVAAIIVAMALVLMAQRGIF